MAITPAETGAYKMHKTVINDNNAPSFIGNMRRASLSEKKLPTIIDTPLGRLDSKSRKNLIENYFSMLKSRLQNLVGLTHEKLKENIEKVIKDIPKEKYKNIFKGAYNRTEKYVKKPSNRTRKLKNYRS